MNRETKEIVLLNQESFHPEHIFECGQAFRWEREKDGSHTVVAHSRVINILKSGKDIIIRNSNEEDFNSIWRNYFDLDTNYTDIKKLVINDEIMKEATEYGYGIRILNQDPFETIISFIISANNRIPQIKKSIELLSRTYGKSIGYYNGREYFSFPTPEELADICPSEVREICRVGFRDKRIVNTAKLVLSGNLNIYSMIHEDRETIRNKLIEVPGIGPKIADCILLFAYKKKESFPVDVWIKRVMETLYVGKEVKKNIVGELGREKFGDYAGVAQQYLFYYGRENNIGKNVKK